MPPDESLKIKTKQTSKTIYKVQEYVDVIGNDLSRSIGGTIMKKELINNSVIITKQTSVKNAISTNRVLMVGRILNRRELGLIQNEPVAVVATGTDDVVEIPAFLLKMQAERKAAKQMEIAYMAEQAKKVQKKKAHTTKPSFKTIFNSVLNLL